MIAKMKHLDLVCVASERDAALERLRRLGAVHLDLSRGQGAGLEAAKGAAADAEKAVRLILKAREKTDDGNRRPHAVAEVLALAADRDTLEKAADGLKRDIRAYAPYGDFDPALAAKLLAAGVDLSDVAELPAKLPAIRLSRMQEKLARVENRIAVDTAKIAVCDETHITKDFPEIRQRIAFEAAKGLMEEQGAVAVVSGWIPARREADLAAAAKEGGWGTLVRDPAADEAPPTLIEPPRLFRPVVELFNGLGIAPGYTEGDVSVPFLCYFSVFFAMLVGDGAYGLILLAATLVGWKKYAAKSAAQRNPIAKSWLVLMTVFSLATVAWGVLSNTWFGAGLPWCKNWATVTWLADPSYNNMMFLCFTIGVSHLMLARFWNGVCTINDSTCLAQFGWAGILLFMYFVTNWIVGIPGFESIPTAMYWVFGASLVGVFGFTLKPSELKTRGGELGMLPLNVMSALGDIISYVRLFAVGLASVKVAENFNGMATGLLADADSWWLKGVMAVAMALILLLGHGLNLMMAALSVLVHAVRLNTLEFSNHKGLSWCGYAYRPFALGAGSAARRS